MTNRIHTANPGRGNDFRFGLFGEKEAVVWEDPLMNPRQTYR